MTSQIMLVFILWACAAALWTTGCDGRRHSSSSLKEAGGWPGVCQLQCHCSKNNTVVNCADRRLNKIPGLPPTLERLVFDDNILDHLPAEVFTNYPKLRHVSLRNNLLSEIAPEAFTGAGALQNLFLDNNSISALEDKAFSDLRELTHLSLAYNRLESLQPLMAAMSGLEKLEDLDLSFNNLSSVTGLPAEFNRLTSLKKLNLRGASIANISSGFFESLSDAADFRYLDLEDNAIESIDPGAFKPLQNIKKLDLSNTSLSQLSVEAAFDGLQNSTVHIIYLQNAFARDTKLAARSPFNHLNNSNLEVLDMEGNTEGLNGILHHEFFSSLHSLQELYLDQCELRRIYSRAFAGLKNLATLDLSNNSITCLQNTCAFLYHGSTMRSLRDLDLSWNNIGSEQAAFVIAGSVVPKLRTLKLNKNKISILSRDMFQSLKSLKMLYLSSNPLMVIQPYTFVEISTLHHLTISHCHPLKMLANHTFQGLAGLQTLQLNHNSLEDIGTLAFTSLKKLVKLDLRDNYLGRRGTEFQAATIDSHRLSYVDLGHNDLASIPRQLLEKKSSLKFLYADYNRLNHVCGNSSVLPHLSALRAIDLSFNSLLQPDVGCLRDNFGNLSAINLTGNPFYCSCSSISSIAWLEALIAPENRAGHICRGPSQSEGVNIFDFQPSSWDCRGLKPVVVALAAVLVIVTVLTVACCVCFVLLRARRRQSDSGSVAESSTAESLCAPLRKLAQCRRGSGPGLDTEYVKMTRDDNTELSIRGSNGDLRSNPRMTNGVTRIDVTGDTDRLVKDVEESNCDAVRNGDL